LKEKPPPDALSRKTWDGIKKRDVKNGSQLSKKGGLTRGGLPAGGGSNWLRRNPSEMGLGKGAFQRESKSIKKMVTYRNYRTAIL